MKLSSLFIFVGATCIEFIFLETLYAFQRFFSIVLFNFIDLPDRPTYKSCEMVPTLRYVLWCFAHYLLIVITRFTKGGTNNIDIKENLLRKSHFNDQLDISYTSMYVLEFSKTVI